MPNYTTKVLLSKPGIQRDGTPFASESYIDGQWCRFYMGRPRKIGGYELIDHGNSEIIRSMFNVQKNNAVDTYLGRTSSLTYIHFDLDGRVDIEYDRTPKDFYPNINNVWDFDLFSTIKTSAEDPDGSLEIYIVATAAPNCVDISSDVEGSIYFGTTTGVDRHAPLVPIYFPVVVPDPLKPDKKIPVTTSGGVIVLGVRVVTYGNAGTLRWSADGEVDIWPSENFSIITNSKIIKAVRGRGEGILLCWTINSLLAATYTLNPTEGAIKASFVSSVIQENITIVSPASVVEFQQQFFWVGIDQFYFYNGIVNTLDNTMCSDYFFKNVNFPYRAKIWGMVIPRYKEIWWHYPRGDSVECNAVIIYNTELKVWYDSSISRAAGLQPNTFPLPMMSDSKTTPTLTQDGVIGTYGLWKHEVGANQVIDGENFSIDSFFETNISTLFEANPSNNRLIRTRRIEPDFVQNGKMTVTVRNRMFASGPVIESGPYEFDGSTEKIDDINSQGRLVSYVFECDEIDNYYQTGKPLLDYDVGDVQP